MDFNRNKILIVDDEISIRLGLAKCMELAGFEALSADCGPVAIRLVEEHRPALVILDVMMQGMSGLEVCRTLRHNPETRDVKIIFLSARGQLRDQAEGLDAGGDLYITKPFDYRELIDTVKQMIGTAYG